MSRLPAGWGLYDGEGDDGRLSTASTLGEFFDGWVLPLDLVVAGRSDAAVAKWRDALAWWSKLTDDPPLAQVDEHCLAAFVAALRAAKWRRGLSGPLRPLSYHTIRHHVRLVMAVLRRAGPDGGAAPCAGFLSRVPFVRLPAARWRTTVPRDCWSVDEMRLIRAAADRMPGAVPDGLSVGEFWRAVVDVLFYVGERAGTALLLEGGWLVDRRDGAWLAVPPEAIPKTHKAVVKPIHAVLAGSIEPVLAAGHSRLVPWAFSYQWFCCRHATLVALALPADRRFSPQAWRRSHSAELLRLGVDRGLEWAAASASHSDARVTAEHYASPLVFLRGLPDLSPSDRGATDA